MSPPRVYRTEGIVLKGFDYGEADRILTLYTPNTGKLRVNAKGVRRTKSRMSGHLDLFIRSSLLVARGRQLDIVTQAVMLESFRPVRTELFRSTHCYYAAELVDAFTVENLANPPVYSLLTETLRRLGSASQLDLVTRAFEMRMLLFLGYQPQLFRCLDCQTTIEPGPNSFSAKLGGVLCPRCLQSDPTASVVSVGALKLMRNLQINDSAVLEVSGIQQGTRREVERLLQDYIVYRLESRPRSISFLERLRREPVAL